MTDVEHTPHKGKVVPMAGSRSRGLAGAISAKADWLLTKDGKHFGHLYGIRVYDVLVSAPGCGLYLFRQLA